MTDILNMPANTDNEVIKTQDVTKENNFIEEDKRIAELITLENCNKGLGLKICGGCSLDACYLNGIFIKYVIPGGVSANNGYLQKGDQIIEVNGESLEGVTKDRALSILRRAAAQGHAEILITRDEETRSEFYEVLEREEQLKTPVNSTSIQDKAYNDNMNGQYEMESPWKRFAASPSLYSPEPLEREEERKTTLSRKTTLDAADKLSLERLEGRLYYLGLNPTLSQYQELHQHLLIDTDNKVTFGNFMQAVKLVFKDELEKGRKTYSDSETSLNKSPSEKSIQYCNVLEPTQDLDTVLQQREDVKKQLHKLEMIMKEKERKHEIELLQIRKELQSTMEENRSLKIKVGLAEQAQVEAQTLEQDYEEAVGYLENEIKDLRQQLKKGGINEDHIKQVTTLACQLKKADERQKMYHAATEKLVAYVEHVQDVLNQPNDSPRKDTDIKKKDKQKEVITSLIKDGQNVIKLVKSLTETAPLPYGWEEAFCEDGTKYFINHVTQTTSWTHPASGVTYRNDNKPSSSKIIPPPPSTSSNAPLTKV